MTGAILARPKEADEQDDLRRAWRAIAEAGAGSGWLVTVKNPAYSGVSAGVQIRDGKGFVSASSPDAEAKVRELKNLGYSVEYLGPDDIQVLREVLDQ